MAKKKPDPTTRCHEGVAWCAWRLSKEGQDCRNGTASGEYLENRLWAAYMAGYDAATLSRIDPDALAKRIVRALLVTGDGAFAGRDFMTKKAAELIRQHLDAARTPAPGERT